MQRAKKSDWLIPLGLVALSLVPALAGVVRLAQLTTNATITPENARFFASPIPVLIHIPAVILFSIVGALQFSPGLRRSHGAWHRSAGKILIACGVLVALTGLWMAHFYAWPPQDGVIVYGERLIAGSAMLISIVISIRAILQRDFQLHGRWMMRAYAIGLGAGTQVLTHVPWFIMMGTKPDDLPRAMMMGAGWVINVAVVEWIVRRRQVRVTAVLVAT